MHSRESSTQRGYDGRWQKARDAYLKANPLCVMHKARGQVVAAAVVDHIKPPRMAEAKRSGSADKIKSAQALFWDKANWQSLCKHCHDSEKQRQERGGAVLGCTTDGLPLDPNHHWNR